MEKYYNGSAVINSGCPINFIIGNRTAGKSYYWKRYGIKQYLKKGEQFIYIRRHKSEIDMVADSFFTDISHEFPNLNVILKGDKFYLKNYATESMEVCGYAFSLTQVHQLKSVVLEKVNLIFFDEFIPENLQYLKPSEPFYEPNLLLSIYLTVARGYKKMVRDNVRLVCAANNITLYNPYFSMFDIDLTNKNRVVVDGVYAEKIINKTAQKELQESKIGKLLMKTEYGAYAVENKSYRDEYNKIIDLPRNAMQLFNLYINRWYTCFIDIDGNFIWNESYDKTLKQSYKMMIVPDTTKKIPWFKGPIVDNCRMAFYQDKMFYTSGRTMAIISGLFTPKTF